MEITVNIAFVSVVLLVAARVAAVFYLTPLFSTGQIPVQVRLMFVLALSVVLVASMASLPVSVPNTLGSLTGAMARELLIGALFAFGIFAAFAAFQLGGRILDMQMGFGVASLIDPVTRTPSPMIGTILNLIAVMVFFAIDGHHMIIRGITFSLQQIPPGSPLIELNVGAIVSQFGAMFSFAIAIVAPPLFGILLLDAGLGVVARTMPQVNIFIVSLPLKILVGLILLAISISYMPPLMKNIFVSIFHYWEVVIGR